MESIIRGTTPIINVTIPGLLNINPVEIWFSFRSGESVYTFRKSDEQDGVSIVEEIISKAFTQDETLQFEVGVLWFQIRLLDNLDMAYATPWLTIQVEDVIQAGVIDPVNDGESQEIYYDSTVSSLYDDMIEVKKEIKAIASAISRTATGQSITTENAVTFPAISLSVAFEPSQSGSGTPSTSNVRPIVGRNSMTITVENEGDEEPTEHSIPFGDVFYGGTVDFANGVLTVTHGQLSPYAGESINEPWLSSMDPFVSGAIPTAGAQVVYPLDEPITVYLIEKPIEISDGTTIETNQGVISLSYLVNLVDVISNLLSE